MLVDGDAADLHRPGGRRGVPHADLQHRRRGPALRRRDRRGLGRPRARRLGHRRGDRGDGGRGHRRRRAVGGDPRRAARLHGHERADHLADAQLHRRAAADLPDLRLRAPTGATRRRRTARIFPTGKTLSDATNWPTFTTLLAPAIVLRGDRAGAAGRASAARAWLARRAAAPPEQRRRSRIAAILALAVFVLSARADERHARAVGGLPLRLLDRAGRRARGLGALPRHALRLRGPRGRRLAAAARYAGMRDEAQDRRGDVPRPAASPRSAARARSATSATSSTPAGCSRSGARLHGHRRRGARPLQPDHGAGRRARARRPDQRRVLACRAPTSPRGWSGSSQGVLLLCTLAGEVLGHYRLRAGRGATDETAAEATAEVSAADVVLGQA